MTNQEEKAATSVYFGNQNPKNEQKDTKEAIWLQY